MASVQFPSAQLGTFRFLFPLMRNSLSLKPTLNPRATPSHRYEFPTAVSSSAVDALGHHEGKTTDLHFAFYNTSELQGARIFARVAPAIYVVKGPKAEGSANVML
jgi:hypothetical protein